jgi:hypothetical protein
MSKKKTPADETGFDAVIRKTHRRLSDLADTALLTNQQKHFLGICWSAASTALAMRLDRDNGPLAVEQAQATLGKQFSGLAVHRLPSWPDPMTVPLDMVQVGEAVAAIETVASRAGTVAAGPDINAGTPEFVALTHVYLDGSRLLATDGVQLRLVPFDVPGLAERLGGGWLSLPWAMLLGWAEVWCADEENVPQSVEYLLDETLTLIGRGVRHLSQLEATLSTYTGLDFPALLAPIEEDVRPWTWHGRAEDVRKAVRAASSRQDGHVVVEHDGVRLSQRLLLAALPDDPEAHVCVRITYQNEPAVVWHEETRCGALLAPMTPAPG